MSKKNRNRCSGWPNRKRETEASRGEQPQSPQAARKAAWEKASSPSSAGYLAEIYPVSAGRQQRIAAPMLSQRFLTVGRDRPCWAP